ncbi:MAG: histidine kinase [Niabella sp.]
MNKLKENNFIARFMFDARYRIWRHVLLIFFVAIITFNQVFIAYQDSQALLGNRIYFICFFSFAMYLTAMYFNYFYLTPRFLIKGKYITFSVLLCIVVFLLPNLSIVVEYRVREYFDLLHRINSYTSPLILLDNLAGSMVTAICFFGVSAILVFSNWIKGNERVNQLEREHLKSELNKLKGQIAPAFLSRALQKATVSVSSDPEKASGILMQLAQLLRYQLYDCNRDKVLLRSEISFLRKFLELEQMNRAGFHFDIHINAATNNVFVTPLLFISIVQHAIKDSSGINLFFNQEHEMLSFICTTDDNEPLDKELFSLIKKRLTLQYHEMHTWEVSPKTVALKINIKKWEEQVPTITYQDF